MLIVGLTGSIGMGKSTIADMFKTLGIKVWNADDAVHEMYKKNGAATALITEEFGNILDKNGGIDRQKLGKIVLANAEKLKILENIVHPLVTKDRMDFIEQAKSNSEKYIIIDVPLLFETNGQANVDKVIVVDCDIETQKARVLSRPNMTEEKFHTILLKQIPNHIKVAKADFVIDTSKTLLQTEEQVLKIHNQLKA